ncbi:MAG: amino acid adenylation domain-containing protein [Paracoccus sp. (in: a-proteobacteria)]|uniref:amino acid adenylation domain-containing protein n=1 Tax=Paracoccus sp. TaxID=267 RepID=UPI0026DFBEE6|nr:amino acid adenylation domain-containing protein [Paracoccus sp. (in: a-proteobacteria)]MDO5622229.1 amino acid adenylation domain-containing protein [Paracoccus sp. (in: a-proteobacteria)]
MPDSGGPDSVAGWPLTAAQEGLWYFQALDPANPILNTGQYLELTGPLDLPRLMDAIAQVVAESDALRLRFAQAQGQPLQWLDSPPAPPGLVDLTAATDPQAEALRQMQADQNRPLNLSAEAPARFTIYRLTPDRHFLYERIHHLAIDGYGMVLVTNRIAEVYSGKGIPLAPYARALAADADYRGSDREQADRSYWQQAMANLPEVSGPAPGRAVSGARFLRHSLWLDPAFCTALDQRSRDLRIGWPDLLTALAGAYLARWTDGETVIGVPFMARFGSPAARSPAMVMNVLPLRLTLDEDAALADWLAGAAAQMAAHRRHGLYRSEHLRRDLGLLGGAKRLYGPLVNVQPFDKAPQFEGLDCRLHILGAGAVDDLTLTFRGDLQSGLLFEVDGNPALYDAEMLAGHATRLAVFLDAALVAETLATVPTATPVEAAAALPDTRHALPDTTLSALIAAQMQANPDAPALRFGDQRLDYAGLDRASAALAVRLRQMGAGPETIVAVALNRSIELPVALLAVLRAGAAYLPLDPDHPPARIASILNRAAPVVVLTSADLAGLMPEGVPLLLTDDWPTGGGGDLPLPAPDNMAPDNMAYVIFTSGSTGEPKGVVIEHRAIVNRLLWMRDHYGFDGSDRILQKTPATFDVSVWEFFLPMICGAELVLAAPGAHRDPAALAALIRQAEITTAHFVPSMLSAFLAAPASEGISLRRVFCSGEELTADQRRRFHARLRAELHNLYGPTEAAVDVSYWPATPDDTSDPLPIGWPVWNTTLHVLDDRMRPVPAGLAGHLYLGGVQLARGYLGQPELTAERFIDTPAGRLYATGDLARLRPDGAVVYLGRSDHQVKLRGLRIELGEIEAAIMASGMARETVVIAREDRAGTKHLVAYLVPADDYAPDRLVTHLGQSLPAYMIPAAQVALEALPLTANGKLDRKALPAPTFQSAGRAAQTPTEVMLAGLFAEILHLPAPPSAEADFFALGGDSLSAVQLVLRIEQETGRSPGLGVIFEHPVLVLLAAALDEGFDLDAGLKPTLLLAEGNPQATPLFILHPAGGLGWGYRRLASELAPARRIWALQHPALDTETALPVSLDALAADYAARIMALVPQGPVHLAGWSVGGILAQAVAVELTAKGRAVGMVAMLDSYPADCWRDEPDPDPAAALRALLAIAGHDPDAHQDLNTPARVVDFLKRSGTALGSLPGPVLDAVIRIVTDSNRLVRRHRHRPYAGPVLHIRAGLDHAGRDLRGEMWHPYAGDITLAEVPFLHAQMISPEAVTLIAPLLAESMARADASGGDI